MNDDAANETTKGTTTADWEDDDDVEEIGERRRPKTSGDPDEDEQKGR